MPDRWDEETSWHLGGAIVLIFEGGAERPSKLRRDHLPHNNHEDEDHRHSRADEVIAFWERRDKNIGIGTVGVKGSKECKEAMLENMASNMTMMEMKEIVEVHYNFEKVYDNVNNTFLDELPDVYGVRPGVH